MVRTMFKVLQRSLRGLDISGAPLQEKCDVALELGDALEHDVSLGGRRTPGQGALLASQCVVTDTDPMMLPLSHERRASLQTEVLSLQATIGLEMYAFCVGRVAREFALRRGSEDEAA